jgi:hypothetical protein
VLSGHRSFLAGTKWQTAGPGDTVVFSRHAAHRSRPRRRGGPRGLHARPTSSRQHFLELASVHLALQRSSTDVGIGTWTPRRGAGRRSERQGILDGDASGSLVGTQGDSHETDRPSSRNDGFPRGGRVAEAEVSEIANRPAPIPERRAAPPGTSVIDDGLRACPWHPRSEAPTRRPRLPWPLPRPLFCFIGLQQRHLSGDGLHQHVRSDTHPLPTDGLVIPFVRARRTGGGPLRADPLAVTYQSMKVCTRCSAEHTTESRRSSRASRKRCAMPIWVPRRARDGVLPPSSPGPRRDRMQGNPDDPWRYAAREGETGIS